jgi:hypothetical protein
MLQMRKMEMKRRMKMTMKGVKTKRQHRVSVRE